MPPKPRLPLAAGHWLMLATVAMLLVACAAGHPAAVTARTTHPESPSPSPPASAGGAGTAGVAGSYRVGSRQLRFTEPAHTGPAGERLGRRELLTTVLFPLARPAGARLPAAGEHPLLMFAPGFMQCPGPYLDLLRGWASAGYLVAAVDFPRTDCLVGASAYEPDLVNQPGDMSYVLSRLLALSAAPHGLLAGRIDSAEIAAAGQSDGGDTVAALAANTCCADHRLAAVAVLSGAEWPPMPGRYFAHQAPPMLFVQGSADTINPPWTSVQLYQADSPQARYYLDLFGATHTVPYWGTNPVERLVTRVTLAFFNSYLLGQADARAAMFRFGDVPGRAELVSGRRPPP
jgi:dienelactone hydrolase